MDRLALQKILNQNGREVQFTGLDLLLDQSAYLFIAHVLWCSVTLRGWGLARAYDGATHLSLSCIICDLLSIDT